VKESRNTAPAKRHGVHFLVVSETGEGQRVEDRNTGFGQLTVFREGEPRANGGGVQ